MKDNSYVNPFTEMVKPYRAYTKDFKNPGEFEETVEKKQNKILLQSIFFVGIFNDNKWNISNSNEEGYLIGIYYFNKNYIEISIDAFFVQENIENSFQFIKKAAKKFFLVNEFIKEEREENPEGWCLEKLSPPQLSWEDVQNLIKKHKTTALSSGNSWWKIMTLTEAKQLFRFLKIEVTWPK